jgi:hypothetical protein
LLVYNTFVTPQNKNEDNRGEEAILKNLDEPDHAGQVLHETLQQDEKSRDGGRALKDLTGFTLMPLKRSKRRENSVDENTSERAE